MEFIKHVREEILNISQFEERGCTKVLDGQGFVRFIQL
jgi:hypothetical protein